MNERITIPNVVTATRLAMSVVAAGLAARAPEAAVVICIVAALLDAFDGWYARAFSACTRVGEHMDPLADKVLMGVVYGWIGIEAASALVWLLVAIVAVREVAMTLFRAYSLQKHGRYIPASASGRAKMLVQSVVGLGVLSITHLLDRSVPVSIVATGLAVIAVFSYASAAAYVADWKRPQELAAEATAPTAVRRAVAGR
jgi:CDP-diacylglycerol--glycerol-3-phosphate 3-phosphatidyltransferase